MPKLISVGDGGEKEVEWPRGKSMNHQSLSKYLCKILRHEPQLAGLALKEGGWVQTHELIEKVKNLNMETLEWIVDNDDKERYSFNQDKSLVRCNWGHSVPIEIDLEPAEPPAVLYHGTKVRHLEAISEQGLRRMERNHVHLASYVHVAEQVARRRKGKSVVLKIDAMEMWKHGHEFYVADNGYLWLTKYVPPDYIEEL